MDPTLPNPSADFHQQKRNQKHHQLQQQFLYQNPSGHFNPDEESPLPSLSHLMHNNKHNNRNQMPAGLVRTGDNTQMKRHVEATGSKVSYISINSSPIPTQVYQATLPQQQQPMIQTKTASNMDSNSLIFYQRSVADMYQQPPPPPSIDSSTFYSNTDQDVHTHPDPSTAVRSSAKITQPSHIVEDQQKVYSFVPLDVISQQKRHRKKFNEVERLYSCTYLNCTKAYGTLNHLNAHVTMQGHGPKRMPIEFKELRRQLKKNRKMMQPPKSRKSSSSAPQKQQKQQQQQQQHIEKDVITNEQDDLLQQHPPSNFYVGEDYGNSSLMMNHPQPHQQQGFSLHGPLSKRPSSISPSFTPLQQQSFEAAASSAAMVSSSLYSTRYSHYTMMQQQQQQQFH